MNVRRGSAFHLGPIHIEARICTYGCDQLILSTLCTRQTRLMHNTHTQTMNGRAIVYLHISLINVFFHLLRFQRQPAAAAAEPLKICRCKKAKQRRNEFKCRSARECVCVCVAVVGVRCDDAIDNKISTNAVHHNFIFNCLASPFETIF